MPAVCARRGAVLRCGLGVPLAAHGTAAGVDVGVGLAVGGAAIGVSHRHPAELVGGDLVEVQHVAACAGATSIPDAAPLNGVTRGGVDGGPGLAAIECVRDVHVPRPIE